MMRRPLLLVLFAAAAAYAMTIPYQLVWDDPGIVQYVARVARARGVSGLASAEFLLDAEGRERLGYYRPVVLLSFHLDALISRAGFPTYHLTNVLLHTANSGLVFLLFAALLPSTPAAAFGALLFALHPVHVESVAFVSGRTDLWAALFVLLAALVWARGPETVATRTFAAPAASGCCLLLGILAKETALVAPAVFLVWDALAGAPRQGWWARNARWVAAWGGAVAVAAALRLLVAGVGFGVKTTEAALTLVGSEPLLLPRIWTTYLRLLSIPWPLSAHYGHADLRMTLPVAAGAALTLGIFLAAGRRAAGKTGWTGLAWTVGFLLPVSGLVPLAGALAAERFLYLPSIGFCLAAGGLAHQTLAAQRLRPALAGAMMLLAAGTAGGVTVRSPIWRNNLSLFEDAARTSPLSAEIHYNLGREYLALGRWNAAATENKRALDLDPRHSLASNNLGVASSKLGRKSEAIAAFRQSISSDPTCAGCYANLGLEYAALGRWGEAAATYAEAVRLAPGHPGARLELGRCWLMLGERARAQEELRRLEAIDAGAAAALRELLAGR